MTERLGKVTFMEEFEGEEIPLNLQKLRNPNPFGTTVKKNISVISRPSEKYYQTNKTKVELVRKCAFCSNVCTTKSTY